MGDHVLELGDGLKIGMRPITVDDRDLLRAFFESMSPDSRTKRFMGYVSALGEEQLDFLTDVDHVDHEALVAYGCDDGALVGVARYVRGAERPDRAELAVAVSDAFQRRGVGHRLVECLATRARQEGILEFTGLLRADNAGAQKLIASFGPQPPQRVEDNLVELAIPVPGPDAGGDGALYGVLREAAAGRLAAAGGSLGRLNHALRRLRNRAKGYGRRTMSLHDVEAVAERLRDLNEEIIDAGRRVGSPVLHLYEQALHSIAALPERLDGGEQVEWLTRIVAAQADFVRAVAKAATAAADRTPDPSGTPGDEKAEPPD